MALTIRHRPRGDEHPYVIASDQLEPPNPIAGTPVVVHVVTPADTPPDRVWVTVSSPERTEPFEVLCVPAGNATSEKTGPGGGTIRTEESEWRAEIGAFEQGTVAYSVFASSGEAIVTVGPFEFTPRRTAELSEIERLRYDDRSILIEYAPSGRAGTRYAQLLEAEADGTLSLRVGDAALLAVQTLPTDVREVAAGAILALGAFGVTVSTRDGTLVVSSADGSEILRESAPLRIVEAINSSVLEVTRSIVSPSDEAFYGLGERYHAFNQRGHLLDTRVYEQYRRQGDRSYIPVPLLVSSRGYGLWTQTLRRCHYDLASSDANTVRITSSDPMVTTRLIPGAPRDIIRIFTAHTGRPAIPPDWVFGPWMSSNEWNSEERLMKEIETTVREDIPASVVVVEAWSDEQTFYIWNDTDVLPKSAGEPIHYSDLVLNPAGKWPDPREMIRRIHERDIRILLWQIPVIKPLAGDHRLHALDEEYVKERGLAVLEADGTPHSTRPGWFTGSLAPDFTKTETRAWWFNKRRYLVEECGVDGFKTDGGEQLWGESTRFSNGLRGDEMINRYPLEYLDAYHETMSGVGVTPLTFSRSGYAGIQKYPVHWAGDQESTWEEFQAVYRAVLNAALSGIAILGWDLAGFAGDIPTAELYKRSVTCAALSPIMQYHSEYNDHRIPSNDRSPWNIAELTGHPGVLSTYRRYAHLRLPLIPYLFAEAEHAAVTGEPLMTPLFYHAPEDPEAWRVGDEHLLGRALLVAPVLEAGCTSRDVYLPAGEWQNVWTGDKIDGPAQLRVDVAMSEIPVYVKSGAPWPFDGLSPFQNLPSVQ